MVESRAVRTISLCQSDETSTECGCGWLNVRFWKSELQQVFVCVVLILSTEYTMSRSCWSVLGIFLLPLKSLTTSLTGLGKIICVWILQKSGSWWSLEEVVMGGLSHRPLPSSVVPNELILFGCWEWSLPMTSVLPSIWTKYCHLVLPLYTPYGPFAATA